MNKIRVGIKMRVTPEQSKKVQEICFENGIYWVTDRKIDQLDKPFLFIDDFISFMWEEEEEAFLEEKNEEVSSELFIRTNGTCVESEAPTEDNNKGEQMAELKLECLVEGYEGTYFEIGQVWETKSGYKLKIKSFDLKADVYKVIMVSDGLIGNYYYTLQGKKIQGFESELDLVKLISTEDTTESTLSEEPQPKTLSEYLKENNAYESFVENTVDYFLRNINDFYRCKEDKILLNLNNAFIWQDTKERQDYWSALDYYIPYNTVYDMNEIVFAEVDRRIAEQKSSTETTQPEFISTEEFNQMLEQKTTTKYMVFVEGRSNPKKVHDSYDSAEKEAKRLSAKEIGCNVFVVEIVKTFKSKVIVEEIK